MLRLDRRHLFQPPIFILKSLEPHQIAHFEAGILRAPVVQRCFANPVLTAHRGGFRTSLKFFKDPDDLGVFVLYDVRASVLAP